MIRAHEITQLKLMRGAFEDYQSGLMPLGNLVRKTEGIPDIIQDQTLKDSLFDDLLALEEVHARMQIGDFDFDKHGRPVIIQAIQEILVKIEAQLTRMT